MKACPWAEASTHKTRKKKKRKEKRYEQVKYKAVDLANRKLQFRIRQGQN
jgi:hypothetical protein